MEYDIVRYSVEIQSSESGIGLTHLCELLDEAQIEVTKDLVKFKMFKTEEEGKEFRKQNPAWGELGHTEKGWYSAYSLPGLLATQAVKEAGEFYKLNVELTAGYIVGTNWKTCH